MAPHLLVETSSSNGELLNKRSFAQFFTPSGSARFMAALFSPVDEKKCRLLDAGAGLGALSRAFLAQCENRVFDFSQIAVSAFEIDSTLHVNLQESLAEFGNKLNLNVRIVGGDFIQCAVDEIQFGQTRYTHAILNPPYKKINNHSVHRKLLRHIGIETVNLYSAFLALAIELMEAGGQIVAIIPRSFCNGVYYRGFREFILKRAAIRHIHLFNSRVSAFKEDGVLQENVILKLEVGSRQHEVTISTSSDDTFEDYSARTYSFDEIVLPGNPERFIHVPTGEDGELADAMRYSLDDIGLSVSTGPVVDFRLKSHLRDMPDNDTVPLLYPAHFVGYKTEWPKPEFKKPNAIARNAETEKWLYPNGFYCVVRRLSSKEERHRIVASVVDPKQFGNTEALGFENHLNVFHESRQGLPEALAKGLAAFLNSTSVDNCFRRFNGHTQVNATDLRQMSYPCRSALVALGNWIIRKGEPSQNEIDERLAKMTK